MIKATLYVAIPILMGVIMNVIIYTRGWHLEGTEASKRHHLPPSWVIASIWIILLGFLGYICYIIRDDFWSLAVVTSVVWFCVAYPVYVHFFKMSVRLLNLSTWFMSIGLLFWIWWRHAPWVWVWSCPLLAWATYVNVVTIRG